MTTQAIVPSVEKVLQRLAKKNSRTQPDALFSLTFGDLDALADALWTLVREGKGGLVGHERSVLAVLANAPFDAHDFLSLLRQLKAANLEWFERWEGRVDGLAYYGWSQELEVLLDHLLATAADRTPLEWADVSEPAGSALLFALGRRGLVEARLIPPDALPRFAGAFLSRSGSCKEQFAGWERLWPPAFFGRAAFACVHDVKEVAVFPENLAPLVEYATPTQLAALVDKMVFPKECVLDWLVSRGKVMIPQLTVRIDPLLARVRKGEWLEDAQGFQLAALAKLRAQNNEPWPSAWLPLVQSMLVSDTEGLDDVLVTLEEHVREKLLLDHLSGRSHWIDNLDPLTRFSTPAVVDALVKVIRKTKRSAINDLEQSLLFKALGQMGSAGQSALATLLEQPAYVELALENLIPNPQNVTKTIELMAFSKELEFTVADTWLRLEPRVRLDLVAQHFSNLPRYFVARMLGYSQHLLQAVELAEKLAETNETRRWRELVLHPPEPLRVMRERIAKLTPAEMDRAQQAFGDYRTSLEERPFDMKKALASFGPDDLPAVVAVTAFRLESRQDHLEALCRHFWPACPEIPWIAMYWWGVEGASMYTTAANVLESAFIEPLVAYINSGVMSDQWWFEILDIFTQWDPVGGIPYYKRFSTNNLYERRIQEGLRAALQRGNRDVVEWLEEALMGKQREFALRFLCTYPVPEVVPTLQQLEQVKLSVKLQKKLKFALEAQKTLGGTIATSTNELSARLVHRMGGAIEALRVSEDGQTWLAHAAENITVWQGEHITTLEKVGQGTVALSLDGRFVLLLRSNGDVDVYEPETNAGSPVRTLHAGEGTSLMVPMPGARMCTVCPTMTARHPLMLWDLESGTGTAHRVDGVPSYAVRLDEQRYIVGTLDEKLTIRPLDTGKVVSKLYGWENYHGGGVYKLVVGNGGKLFGTLYADGTLMIWGMSESQNRGLGRHANAAPRAIVADPGSSWIVTAAADEVRTWKDGQPARSLVGSGRWEAQDTEVTGGVVFVRPNIVAIGGQCLHVWDLAASKHLGRWDKPNTALVSVDGRLVVGDADGNIWALDV